MAREEIHISLKYDGPEVEDGSMAVEDIVPILEGFAGAYGKLAYAKNQESSHRIRITGIRHSSADIILEVWQFVGENVDNLVGAGVVGGLGISIIKCILSVVKLKRHTQNKPYTESISRNDNNVNVINHINVQLEVPFEAYEYFKNKRIDSDLSKITRPLQEGQINSVDITFQSDNVLPESEQITYKDREYFALEEREITTTREVWIDLKLNRLTKTTNNGTAFLSNGDQVSFSYVGKNPHKIYSLYGYNGPLRAHCNAKLDESLRVIRLDIFDVEKTNLDMLPPDPTANLEE